MISTPISSERNSRSNPRLCRYCREDLRLNAKVCPRCNRPQSLRHFYLQNLSGALNVLLTFGLLALTTCQFMDARRESIRAKEAVQKANETAESLKRLEQEHRKAFKQQQGTLQRTNEVFSELFSEICTAFDGAYELPTRTCLLKNGRRLTDPNFVE